VSGAEIGSALRSKTLNDDLGKEPAPSEITPEDLYLRRREFVKSSLLLAATAAGVGGGLLALLGRGRRTPVAPAGAALEAVAPSTYSTAEPRTSYLDVTTYNNFYEFGTDKSDPAANAHTLRPRPWTVAVEGEVSRPLSLDVDEVLGSFPLEERVYRMRCVEGRSMVALDRLPSGTRCAARSHLAREVRGVPRPSTRSRRRCRSGRS
jgi:sulfoxide reductase catalytic subunit YedY